MNDELWINTEVKKDWEDPSNDASAKSSCSISIIDDDFHGKEQWKARENGKEKKMFFSLLSTQKKIEINSHVQQAEK